MRSGPGIICGIIVIVFTLFAEGLALMPKLWMIDWAEDEELLHQNSTLPNSTFKGEGPNTTGYNLKVYIVILVAVAFSAISRCHVFFLFTGYSARNLHNQMFVRVLRAPMDFFDRNPLGRILNRFARDTGLMDDLLPFVLQDVLQFGSIYLVTMGLMVVVNPWTLLIWLPFVPALPIFRYFTLKTMREVKRIEAITRSPIFSHISSSLEGLHVLRAFKMEAACTQTFEHHLDKHTSATYIYYQSTWWLGQKMGTVVVVFMAACLVAVFCLPPGVIDPGLLGVSLLMFLTTATSFGYMMRQSAEMENVMTSVERIQQYKKLDQEAPEHTELEVPTGWPCKGEIDFDHVYMSYTDHGPQVLNDICIQIQGGQKVGVVGRTGAGKSSLVVALLRLAEPEGHIWIDGVDIAKLGLTDLRQVISTIPQDPVLFQGKLRHNLDPSSEYSEDQLWHALHQVRLHQKVSSLQGQLDEEMSEGGSNFSVGQRQLICLARAILRKNQIILIDEATANVDQQTDALIQKTIRNQFQQCTVICVAHRLNTIIHSDKILVLDNGQVQQFDHAHILLQDTTGMFYQMVEQMGAEAADQLKAVAAMWYQGQDDHNNYTRHIISANVSVKNGNLYKKETHAYINPGFEHTHL